MKSARIFSPLVTFWAFLAQVLERGLERAVARRGQFALIEIMLRAVNLEDARALRLGIQGR